MKIKLEQMFLPQDDGLLHFNEAQREEIFIRLVLGLSGHIYEVQAFVLLFS